MLNTDSILIGTEMQSTTTGVRGVVLEQRGRIVRLRLRSGAERWEPADTLRVVPDDD